jgi:dihydropteroate synthase
MQAVQIMAILNITPDSFSDGGIYYNNPEKALARAKEMLLQGADSIDIGGESSRPGAQNISTEEELQRVIPVIMLLRKYIGNTFTISIDTYKASVAREALAKGANMVNSLGGFTFDPSLVDVVSKYKCLFCMYHIKGTPQTMQKGEITYIDVVKDIIDFFTNQIAICKEKGIDKKQLIIDPGIGFGKTVEQNIEILQRLKEFKSLGLPILIGLSRKSWLAKILKEKLDKAFVPQERIEAGLAGVAVAVENGASIIRTHDVLQTKTFLTVLQRLQQ